MAHDVFISYAAEDRSAAETARAALEAQGVSCWIAPRDVLPGEDETESFLAAIDASSVVVLCLSSAANASKLVTQQAARAFNKHIPIVPLRIEDVEPSDALKLFFGTQEAVDAYVPPLEGNLQRLLEIVAVLLTRSRRKKQEAVSDVVSASAADGEPAWLEPWAFKKGGKLQKTAPPEAEEYRRARGKDQPGGKRSMAPVLLVAGVLIIGMVIAASLASHVFPSELIPSFSKEAQQQEQIETPSSLSGEGELQLLVQTTRPGNVVHQGDTMDISFHTNGSFENRYGSTGYWAGTYSFSTTKDLTLSDDTNTVNVTLNTDGTFSWVNQGDPTPFYTGTYTWVKSFG
jgi:hypothetical protein